MLVSRFTVPLLQDQWQLSRAFFFLVVVGSNVFFPRTHGGGRGDNDPLGQAVLL